MPATNHRGNRNRTPRNPYKKPKQPTEGEDSRPKSAHKVLPTENRSADALPGLSKIKASIRQTKRLLAKENLEPGLRVQTQRRLTSLEADLAAAEKREVEKKNGAKYHMVKFFDRQKLLRITKRLHRKLAEEGKSDKKRARFDQELQDARVMLNYVLNFPNTQKYISLFPSSANATSTTTTTEKESSDEPKLSLPALLHPVPEAGSLDKPSQSRYDILLEIQRLMDAGTLSSTPEDEVKDHRATSKPVLELGGSKKADKAVRKEEEEKDDFFEADEDE